MELIIPFETKWKRCDHITLLVMADDVPVGTCMVDIGKQGEDAGKAFLWNLQVDMWYRKRGFGRHLLETAIELAKNRGCSEMRLEWFVGDSPRWVLHWYERNGFQECAFSRDIVQMRLDLEGGEQ